MDAAAEAPEALESEGLTVVVEWQRRHENYGLMEQCANVLGARLQQDASPATMARRSKLSYEWCMALSQRADALLKEAIVAAERSAKEAGDAGDAVGRLYGIMAKIDLLNKAGRWEEAFDLSESSLREAAPIVTEAKNAQEYERVQRLIMNLAYHRMNIAVDRRLRKGLVDEMVALIQVNPVYEVSRHEKWAREPIERARAYVQS